MSNDEFDRRIQKLTERHEALAQSVELLRGSVSDLTAVARSLVDDAKQQRERDRQYFRALAELLNQWGNGGPQ